MQLLLVAPAIIAFFVGVRWGRRASAIALAIFIVGVFVTIYMASAGLGTHAARGVLGFASAFGTLVALGPLAFTRWPLALIVSAAAVALFIVSGLPLFTACAIFGACEAYP